MYLRGLLVAGISLIAAHLPPANDFLVSRLCLGDIVDPEEAAVSDFLRRALSGRFFLFVLQHVWCVCGVCVWFHA